MHDNKKHDDIKLKLFLVLQSFCPLFVLLFIQHAKQGLLVYRFFSSLPKGLFMTIGKALSNPSIGEVIISILCVMWFIFTFCVGIGFHDLQNTGFDTYGEKITIVSEKRDSGVSFLVTFILPLLIEDVSTYRGLLFFIVLLSMVIFLVMRSNLFYQNPVLASLNYKVFEFQFINPHKDVDNHKKYVGICKDSLPLEDKTIRRRLIADNVYMIYQD